MVGGSMMAKNKGMGMKRKGNDNYSDGFIGKANHKIVSLDEAVKYELKYGRRLKAAAVDRRKLRRTISNRLSAQRSRMKRAQYIHDMERMLQHLQEAIAGLSSQIETNKEELKLLLLQNISLHHLLQTKSNHSKIRQMELEKTQVEALRLKALFPPPPPSAFNSSDMAAFAIPMIKPPLLPVDEGVEVVDEYIDFDAVDSQPPNHI